MTAKVSCKNGVKFSKDSLALGRILATILLLSYDGEIVITSGSDGIHKPDSKHYKGEAIDIRTSNLPDVVAFQKLLVAALGPKFSVLNEGDHLHLQVRLGGVYP